MKKLLSFEEFVNEHYNVDEATDADGFNPAVAATADEVTDTIKDLSGLIPGKEYEFTANGNLMANMMFQGVTDGVYIFNSENQEEAVRYTEEEMTAIITSGAKQMAM
jgi:hypothetical protein